MNQAEEALQFETQCFQELNSRVDRSQLVGSHVKDKGKASLFFNRMDDAFTLQVNQANQSLLYDCIEKTQWGRRVMVFGRKTQSGGFCAQGHAVVEKKVCIRFANGMRFFIPFDHSEPCLQRFIPGSGVLMDKSRHRTTELSTQSEADDDGDFSERDLARLRGDISVSSRDVRRERHK